MILRVRFANEPGPALRRTLAARFRLVAGGGSAWHWQGAVARFSSDGELAAALAIVDALAPIREIDRGDGFEPFTRETAPAAAIDFIDAPTALMPIAPIVPDAVRARFVFDDHVVPAPNDRYVAFVRDAQRCHFETLHLVDRDLPPISTGPIHDYPHTVYSADGERLLIGGPLDVLEVALDSGALTRLDRDDNAAGFNVCYLTPSVAAAIGGSALRIYALDGERPDGPVVRRIACVGGRLLRAVLGGRVLVAGSDGGTFVIGVRDGAMRLLHQDWRSLFDVWEADGRVLCTPTGEGICELTGLEAAWEAAFAADGDDPGLTLAL